MWAQTKNEHEKQPYEHVFIVDRAAAGASVFARDVEREMGQEGTMPQTFGPRWMD